MAATKVVVLSLETDGGPVAEEVDIWKSSSWFAVFVSPGVDRERLKASWEVSMHQVEALKRFAVVDLDSSPYRGELEDVEGFVARYIAAIEAEARKGGRILLLSCYEAVCRALGDRVDRAGGAGRFMVLAPVFGGEGETEAWIREGEAKVKPERPLAGLLDEESGECYNGCVGQKMESGMVEWETVGKSRVVVSCGVSLVDKCSLGSASGVGAVEREGEGAGACGRVGSSIDEPA
jgi:hypothetical protein